jgi:FKBP-type peptidyl-prolyl cis-trans isomerase FklB
MSFSGTEQNPSTPLERKSYSIGADIGASLKAQGLDLSSEHLTQGLIHSLSGQKLLVSSEDIQTEIRRVQETIIEKQMQNVKKQSDENTSKGLAYLEENQTRENVITLSSGLQYEVIAEGEGPIPQATDTVKVHYRGTLIDGSEFDSSYRRNEPSIFPVGAVIPGWTEALMRMPAGSKWRVVVPSNLAYGEFGAGSVIGPNETLIFEIELLSIES